MVWQWAWAYRIYWPYYNVWELLEIWHFEGIAEVKDWRGYSARTRHYPPRWNMHPITKTIISSCVHQRWNLSVWTSKYRSRTFTTSRLSQPSTWGISAFCLQNLGSVIQGRNDQPEDSGRAQLNAKVWLPLCHFQGHTGRIVVVNYQDVQELLLHIWCRKEQIL